MRTPDGRDDASDTLLGRFDPGRLRRIGLLLGLCGIPLFLVGVGTAIDYLCCQSHPVPTAVAFSLKLEFTVAGSILMAAGLCLLLLPPRSSA